MSERRNKATFITANFADYEYNDVVGIVDNVLQYVSYKSKNKGYCYNILAGISQYSSDTNYYYETNSKKGRPKKVFHNNSILIPYRKRHYVPPEIVKTHIHILVLG